MSISKATGTAGPHQGDTSFAIRSLESATRTPLIAWLWARHCGARDGLAGLPELVAPIMPGPPPAPPERGAPMPAELMTEFIRGRIHNYDERDEHEFNSALASVGPAVRELHSLTDQIVFVEIELDTLAAKVAGLDAEPRMTAADVSRGPAENNTAESIVVARRQRVKDAAIEAARRQLTALESRISDLRRRQADLAHQVRLAFQHYVTRTDRARAQIERLCAEYRRQVTHRHPAATALQRAWADTVAVPTPSRTHGPCPWVPSSRTGIPAAPTSPTFDISTKEN